MTFPMQDYRVLVTGSRELDDAAIVGATLMAVYITEIHPTVGWRMVVVHGKCRTGADMYAGIWARRMTELGFPVIEEPHPANWRGPCHEGFCKPGHRRMKGLTREYCPAAGNWRNDRMVKRGAHECLAFYKKGAANLGTSDCVERAEEAGIRVRKVDG